MKRLWAAMARSLYKCFLGFKSGPLEDSQRLVLKLPQRCLGCMLRDIVVLKDEMSLQSQVMCTLERRVTKTIHALTLFSQKTNSTTGGFKPLTFHLAPGRVKDLEMVLSPLVLCQHKFFSLLKTLYCVKILSFGF